MDELKSINGEGLVSLNAINTAKGTTQQLFTMGKKLQATSDTRPYVAYDTTKESYVYWAANKWVPFGPGVLENYQEMNPTITPSDASAWVVRNTAFPNSLLEIHIQKLNNGGADVAGVRRKFDPVENPLPPNRNFQVRRGSQGPVSVLTDANGDIEIFSTDLQVIFTIMSVNK